MRTGTGKGKNSREFEAFSRCPRTPGQTPTATELASPHTAGPLARKLRQSLLNFCPCPSLPYCRPLFSDHRFTSAQIALLEQVRWSNAYFAYLLLTFQTRWTPCPQTSVFGQRNRAPCTHADSSICGADRHRDFWATPNVRRR